MKSRVFLPALLAVGLAYAALASSANAFELLNRLTHRGHGGCCPSTCGCEPSCCPAAACAPACGHEQACCPAPACAPACGHEPSCCPAAACAPACGCEPSCCPTDCCDACQPCCKPRRVGLLQRLFAGRHRCNSCCAPACGCEPACAPAPTCGCGH